LVLSKVDCDFYTHYKWALVTTFWRFSSGY
jgi:hypothetical protein